jgi:hypothetical protein
MYPQLAPDKLSTIVLKSFVSFLRSIVNGINTFGRKVRGTGKDRFAKKCLDIVLTAEEKQKGKIRSGANLAGVEVGRKWRCWLEVGLPEL